MHLACNPYTVRLIIIIIIIIIIMTTIFNLTILLNEAGHDVKNNYAV